TTDENKDDFQKYVSYILKNDATERMESYEWIRNSIDRINKYIRLCYYLSFINSNDNLEIRQNNIYVNINTESIINNIPLEYKYELMNVADNIDKNASNKLLVIVPCKWIIYEYRNIFRYL